MTTGHAIQPQPLHAVTLAPPGTPAGNAARLAFAEATAANIASPVRIWLPKSGETTTSTTVDSNKATATYSASLATWATTPTTLGSGMVLTFDGTNDWASMPDANDLSFGNATVDEPFSVGVFVKVATSAGFQDILTKYDLTTGATKREYLMFLSSQKLVGDIYDESTGGRIGRSYNTALTAGSRYLLGMSYDGRAASAGLGLWVNGVKSDDTADDAGAYTAMENTASIALLGAHTHTDGTKTSLWGSDMYYAFICAGELHLDQWRRQLLITDYYYGTTLSA